MMRRLGVRNLSGVVSAVHGQPMDPRLAQRGDLVRSGWALGICRGEVAEFFNAARPMAEVDEAWRIGARNDG